jgi:hypothetical protein
MINTSTTTPQTQTMDFETNPATQRMQTPPRRRQNKTDYEREKYMENELKRQRAQVKRDGQKKQRAARAKRRQVKTSGNWTCMSTVVSSTRPTNRAGGSIYLDPQFQQTEHDKKVQDEEVLKRQLSLQFDQKKKEKKKSKRSKRSGKNNKH